MASKICISMRLMLRHVPKDGMVPDFPERFVNGNPEISQEGALAGIPIKTKNGISLV